MSLEKGAVDVDVSALGADLASVDALARMRLAARRAGHGMRFLGVSAELRDLLGLTGLREVLGVEVERQPEEREEAGGVEEEGELGHPSL